MSDIINDLLGKVSALTQTVNQIISNSKSVPELPAQTNLDANSLLPVSRAGNSERISVQQIINAVNNNQEDQLLNVGSVSLVGNDLTISSISGKINNVIYTIPTPTIINVPYCATGLNRMDLIVYNSNNNLIRIPGIETGGSIIVAPTLPLNSLEVTQISVSDSSIGEPESPILGASYVKKIYDKIAEFNGSGTNVNIPLTPEGYSEIRLINSSLSSISGIDLTLMTGANFEAPYAGKTFYLWNKTGVSVTLKNEDLSNSDYPLFLMSGADLVLQNNEIIEFKFDAGGLYEFTKKSNVAQLTDSSFGAFSNSLQTEDELSDSDKFSFVDTSDSNKQKKTTWLNIKAKLKTAFDLLYQSILVSGTNIKTINGNSILGSGNLTISGGDSYFTIEMSMGIGNFTQVSYDRIPLRDSTTDPFPMGEYFDPVTSTGDFRCAAKIIPANSELKAVFFRVNNLSNDLRLRVLAFDAMSGSITNITTLALKTIPAVTGVKVFKYDLSEILNTSTQPEGRLITLAFFTPTGPVSFQSNRITCLFKKV